MLDADGPEWVDVDVMAARAGVSRARVLELASAGVITAGPDGRFPATGITAIRYAEVFLASGTPLTAIAEAARRGLLFFDTVGSLYPPVPHTDITLEHLAERTRLGVPALQTVLTALGLPTPPPSARLRADDVRLLELIVDTWGGGPATTNGGPPIRAALGYGATLRSLVELEHGLYFEAVNPELRGVVTDGTERHQLSAKAAEAIAAAAEIVTLLHARLMEQQIARTSVDITEAFLGTQGSSRRATGSRGPSSASWTCRTTPDSPRSRGTSTARPSRRGSRSWSSSRYRRPTVAW